eukprot:31529-Pelagococcus_subviridis.AAC.19
MSGWSSKASIGVQRRRGRGLKAGGGRRESPAKVLKDRRSPRERGRMGTSVRRTRLRHLQHVGLLHGAQAVRALLRGLEPDARDTLDLRDGVDHRVEPGLVPGVVHAEALRLAEVDAADELSDEGHTGSVRSDERRGGVHRRQKRMS